MNNFIIKAQLRKICKGASYAKNFSSSIKHEFAKNSSEVPIRIGQPTGYTHPHLLKTSEVVVGITKDELKQRRRNLLESIARNRSRKENTQTDHIIIIPSATKKYISDKIPYVFRQNSDFRYFSGCLEPDSVLLMHLDGSGRDKSVLFLRPKDKHAELWDGTRTGPELAVEIFGVDESHEMRHFPEYLEKLGSNMSTCALWGDHGILQEQPEVFKSVMLLAGKKKEPLEALTAFAHKQRLIKSPAEVELMRKTCQIASEAINRTISESKSGDSEHQVFARVDYHCRMRNADFLAYPPVVASGNNATTIHYIENSQIIESGRLVLMDAGCEYGGYTSDITRTWPIDGHFSPTQKILYDVILTLQKDLLATLLNDGGTCLDDLFDTMCVKLGKYLQEVGLVSKSLSGVSLARAAYSFCPHHVSHYLGMDVHDTPTVPRTSSLVPGMVFTVEPGMYISQNRRDVPENFRRLGIRIEDDCVVTPTNTIEVLTSQCAKEVKDLENLVESCDIK
ncbi:xaa-Pro aminopeptidase 3 [Lutzomyia longipalpis]|uniref:xaa-Pro aminopeptidase 3 n=1 Tax=Lutzomyia longipalpis TaxID=7200 RepID=UPI002483714C|nr:xaa-Pro aminopeptidase 3 [Lutzomyia longipalpis]